jgi:hypothetical protein
MIGAALVRWYRRVYRRKPGKKDQIWLQMAKPTQGLVIGRIVDLTYEANGVEFKHRYSTRPLLVVSSDGRQTFIVKGRCRFTDRGFIG